MKSWRSWIVWLLPHRERSAGSSKETRSGWSLRLRLLISVGLVLIPPACLGILQGIVGARHDMRDLNERLVATTREAAAPAENILASARQVALALSNLPDVRDATAGCDGDLARVIRGLPDIANIVRLDSDGNAICAALHRAVGMRLGDQRLWNIVRNSQDFVVSGARMSRAAHRTIVLGLLPLRSDSGAFEGALDVGIKASRLVEVLKLSRLPQGSVMAIFDRANHLIAASDSALATSLFLAKPINPAGAAVHTARDGAGKSWACATAPLLGQNVFVGFAMPDTRLFGEAYLGAVVDIGLPILMILLTWLAIWIVTDRQLTRWIIYLRRVTATYRSGHYMLRPAISGAPSEIRVLGDGIAEMAASIQDRDRSLREAITQKSLLLKEIHHRVKNNLQIVMSLLSLQAMRLKDHAAQEALKQTRARINALALVHRILYEIDDQRMVDVKRLLELLAEQMNEGFGGDRQDIHVVVEAIPREVPGEMALPLALFAAEALTNAFKHAFPSRQHGTIRVVFEAKDERSLRLAIEDDGVGFDYPDPSGSIGTRLIKTFGLQVGGTAEIRSRPGGSTVEIVFPDPEAPQTEDPEIAAEYA